jgi:SAM-dependent methyltransferase
MERMPDLEFPTNPSGEPRNWFATRLGQQWTERFQQASVSEVARVYGHAGIFLRPCEQASSVLSGSMVSQLLTLHRVNRHFEGAFSAKDVQLPIADESVSLVYALCVLETSAHPDVLIEELSRCLKPEGVLIVVSLNGFSAGRLRWAGQGLSPLSGRYLEACCRKNSLEVIKQNLIVPLYGQMKTPPRQPRLGLLTPFYAGRILVAKRRTAGLTPLRKTMQKNYRLNPRISPG